MATLIPTDHPLFRSEAHVQASGHAVEMCSAATGHTVRAVAFCDTPGTASALVAAVEAARAPIAVNLAGYDAQKVTDEIHQLIRDGRGVQGTVYAALLEAYTAGRAARPWASHPDQMSPMTVGPEEYFGQPSPQAAATSPDAIMVEALEGDSNLRVLIDDLRPYAERTLGSLRIGMADVRSILALHAAALALVEGDRS